MICIILLLMFFALFIVLIWRLSSIEAELELITESLDELIEKGGNQ